MGLITSIRRGAGRAAYEADRLMRANRARTEIAALHARIDDEYRQMGARLVDLFQAGALPHPEFEPACQRVLRLRAEIVEKGADLDAILDQHAPTDASGATPLA
jgi:hypothetical protein